MRFINRLSVMETLGFLATLAALSYFIAHRVEAQGPDEQGYSWVKNREPVPQENRHIHFIRDGNIGLQCGLEWGALECVRVDKRTNSADAYLPANAPEWLIAHAQKHMDGWDHPKKELHF